MKIKILTALVIVLIALTSIGIDSAYADSLDGDKWGYNPITGNVINFQQRARVREMRQAESIILNDSMASESIILMQDLNQCIVSNQGQLLCSDICGGRSVPYTVCSFE